MSKKQLGRPPSEDSMKERIQLRVDSETKRKLVECAKILNLSISDVIRNRIEELYDDLKKDK